MIFIGFLGSVSFIKLIFGLFLIRSFCTAPSGCPVACFKAVLSFPERLRHPAQPWRGALGLKGVRAMQHRRRSHEVRPRAELCQLPQVEGVQLRQEGQIRVSPASGPGKSGGL